MASVRIGSLHKSYGSVQAVRGVDLDIPDGEFTVLVGPSGCGKSTLLRTIAGLEDADAGEIEIGGEIVNHMRPRDRDVAMVFQDYALYPHMTVFGNISLSLRARRMPKQEIEERVRRVAGMLGVGPLLDRYPRQLSGGQRQRVAIGRAMVRNPRVFLFDEPLSNLDAQLRDEMRGEIKRLHQEVATTMIYVTHDQVEAMTLADRIVLLRDGRIEQQGAPLDLFERPATLFVAGFLGSPRMNFVKGTLERTAEGSRVKLSNGGPILAIPQEAVSGTGQGADVILGFRPEHVRRAADGAVPDGQARVESEIELVQPTGSRSYATFRLGGQPAIAELQTQDVSRAGERIEFDINLRRAVLFEAGTGMAFARMTAMTKAIKSAEPSRAVKLCGTEEIDAPSRKLSAGALTVELENGQLRYVAFKGVEALRGIAFLVRDQNWGTYTPRINSLSVKEEEESFTVEYKAICEDADQRLEYEARITGSSDGSLAFGAVATPQSDFVTNRVGFVVLHPARLAGQKLKVTHVDGREEETRFPERISPSQPVFNIRALCHEAAPGLWATCRMEGDAFEMEDQRNWTDASYKTYVRPLALPWGYTLAKGSRHEQSVRLSFTGAGAGGARRAGGAIAIELGRGLPLRMPELGVALSNDEVEAASAAGDAMRALKPRFLVCHADMRTSAAVSQFERIRQVGEAAAAKIVLEIVVPDEADPSVSLEAAAAAAKRAGLTIDSIVVSTAADLKSWQPGAERPEKPTVEAIARAARAAFPEAKLGGGMLSTFTELNRKRPKAELFDFITHTTCSIVHAADDRSVMETLETVPAIIGSTRAMIGETPYRVGPSAIAARMNPYGKGVLDNPENRRVCLTNRDPRQRGLFNAAWTLGYVAACAYGGAASVAMGAASGPLGFIHHRAADHPQPCFDSLDGHAVYPAFHVMAGLANGGGRHLIETRSSEPRKATGLAWREGARVVLWITNFTAEPQTVRVGGLEGARLQASVVDASAFEQAVASLDALDALRRPLEKAELNLDAYAVARVEVTDKKTP